MSDVIATETAPATPENAVPEAAQTPEAQAPDTAKAQPQKAQPSASPDEKAYRVYDLEKKVTRNPDTVLNDEDQALYEEFVDGKITPKKRPEPAEAKDSKPDTDKEESKAKENSEPKDKKESKETPEISADVEAAMKEVGAKTPAELTAKIKGLRAHVSGKETDAVTALKVDLANRAERTEALIRDLMEGKPSALQFVEQTYGLRPKAVPQVQTQSQGQEIDPETLAEADALTGGITSKVISQNKALMERLDKLEGNFQTTQKAQQEYGIRQTVTGKLVDEMIAISQNLEGLKDIPGLRNVIIDRVVNGKEDPRLDAFNELFQIAEENAVNGIPLPLTLAHDIRQGRNMAFLLAQAEEKGRKSAYEHKPSKSLSSVQTEDAEKQTYTDEQYEAMGRDYRLIPKEFTDANGTLVQAKIPKRGWKHFGFE